MRRLGGPTGVSRGWSLKCPAAVVVEADLSVVVVVAADLAPVVKEAVEAASARDQDKVMFVPIYFILLQVAFS